MALFTWLQTLSFNFTIFFSLISHSFSVRPSFDRCRPETEVLPFLELQLETPTLQRLQSLFHPQNARQRIRMRIQEPPDDVLLSFCKPGIPDEGLPGLVFLPPYYFVDDGFKDHFMSYFLTSLIFLIYVYLMSFL